MLTLPTQKRLSYKSTVMEFSKSLPRINGYVGNLKSDEKFYLLVQKAKKRAIRLKMAVIMVEKVGWALL